MRGLHDNKHMTLTTNEFEMLEQFKRSATALVINLGRKRRNGEIASQRTIDLTLEVIHAAGERLWTRLDMKIRDVAALDEKHIRALVRDWYANGMKPKTIQGNVSRMRQIYFWIGKPGVIPARNGAAHYLPEVMKEEFQVTTAAVVSKSWTERGIDPHEIIALAMREDIRMGCMLMLGLAFGLRRKEQLMIQPWKADAGSHLMINSNIAKSGKDRLIPIETEFQKWVIAHCKKHVRKGMHVGWPGYSYLQATRHYNYVMAVKLKISGEQSDCVGHGLRAEYAEDSALRLGLIPPTLGGTVDQMPKERREQIQLYVSNALGHHRLEITSAYYGSFKPLRELKGAADFEYKGHTVNYVMSDDPDKIIGRLEGEVDSIEVLALSKPAVRAEFQKIIDRIIAQRRIAQ